MEIVKAKMSKEVYFKIPQNIRNDIEISEVTIDDYDYSDNEKWSEARKESTKAYKKLKEIEFKIRNNEGNN